MCSPFHKEIVHHHARVDLSKALDPLKDTDYVLMVMTLANAIHRGTAPISKAIVAAAVADLDVDWDTLTPTAALAATRAVNEAMRGIPGKVLPVVEAKMAIHVPGMLRRSRRRFATKFRRKISLAFDKTDKKTVEAINDIGLFARDEFGRRMDFLQTEMESIVRGGLSIGLRNEDISKQLRDKAQDVGVKQSKHYWRTVANNAMNRARTFGLLTGMDRAGIENYLWSSVMDENTTSVCRLLDGKRFSVQSGLDQYTQLRSSITSDPEAMTTIMPFVRSRTDSQGRQELFVTHEDGTTTRIATVTVDTRGQKDKRGSFSNVATLPTMNSLGLTMPPIHHLCRSTILPDI